MAVRADGMGRNPRVIGIVTTILALSFILIAVTLALPSNAAPTAGIAGGMAYPANLQAIANSCGPVYRWEPKAGEYGIIPDSFYERYKSARELPVPQTSMTLPVYGYMDRNILPKTDIKYYGVTQDPKFTRWQLLRIMYEYKTTVIWYLPSATTPDDEALLQKFAKTHSNVMVLPWTESDLFITGRAFAVSTWGMEQSCQTLDVKVLTDYAKFAVAHEVPRPAEAPVAKMTKYGVLPNISSRD